MAKLMTVAETSRRHGKLSSAIYYELYTRLNIPKIGRQWVTLCHDNRDRRIDHETICFSHGQFGFVVEALDYA